MARPGYEEVVLLTGFPSFAARSVCAELLATGPRTFVHAVVPASLEAAARDAIDALPAADRGRVNLVEGDASVMDLGLSGKEIAALSAEVDGIHHMAQAPHLTTDRKVAERVHLGGAREILEIARTCVDLKSIVVHSSAFVSGDREGLVLETELDRGQGFRNVVEETLARAEKLLRSAVPSLPVTIVRPTLVVGDSRTGEVDRFGWPYFLLLLVVTSAPDLPLSMPGSAQTPLHLVPVDYYARAACAIGRDPRASGRTFHVGDPAPPSVKRVFELVAAAGSLGAAIRNRGTAGFLPASLTKMLRTPGIEQLARSPRALFEALSTRVTYSFAGTTELFADTDVRCPPLESYVERLVDYVQTRLREDRAREAADAPDPLLGSP